ncbi:radical SAM protein, partial [Campylobacter jejuni]
ILDTKREVVQMHFGGGTPTFFSAKQLQSLILKIRSVFGNFSKDAEISCEIDPRFLNEEQAIVLTQNGFNRISFGVQDFDEKVQKEIHRIQSFELTQNALNLV